MTTTFATVGAGWRAQFFWRSAAALPSLDCVGAVVRTPRSLPVPAFGSVAECLDRARPDVVVTAVPWPVTPVVAREVVEAGVPVLAETPPAPDLPGLRALWADVGASGLVQVAEQYLMMPSHAARLAAVRAGTVGRPTQVQVSSTHQYHAVSILRGMLGAGFGPVSVRAASFEAPLVDPLTRDGWTGGAEAKPAATTLALLDFGGGRSGVYDFTDNQWFNPLRGNRIVIRGSHGEIVDDRVTRLVDPVTAIESPLVRRQTGIDLNLEGFDLDHISHDGVVVYRNPYQGARLAEDDISVAAIAERMAAWCRGEGPEPYSLADACQDHLVALAIEESARTASPVRTTSEAWAR